MKRTWMWLLVFTMVMAGTVEAQGAAIGQFDIVARSTMMWDTLRITADPGLAVTVLPNTMTTRILMGASLDLDETFPGWDNSVARTRQWRGLRLHAEATANDDAGTEVRWSSYPDGRNHNDYAAILRQAMLHIEGTGTAVFEIDYSFDALRQVDRLSAPYPTLRTFIYTEAHLNLLSQSRTYSSRPATLLLETFGADSASDSGTLRVEVSLVDGDDTFTLSGSNLALAAIHAPEAGSLLFLAAGLAGLGILRRRR